MVAYLNFRRCWRRTSSSEQDEHRFEKVKTHTREAGLLPSSTRKVRASMVRAPSCMHEDLVVKEFKLDNRRSGLSS